MYMPRPRQGYLRLLRHVCNGWFQPAQSLHYCAGWYWCQAREQTRAVLYVLRTDTSIVVIFNLNFTQFAIPSLILLLYHTRTRHPYAYVYA